MCIRGLLLLLTIALALPSCQEQPILAKTPVPAKKTFYKKFIIKKPDTLHDTVCIAAVGDMMLGSSYPDQSKLPPDSAKQSFKAAEKYFANADVVFGNLEGTLLDSGKPNSSKKKMDRAFLFQMPTHYGKVFRDAGFNLVSIANNHITDFGVKGSISTTQTLTQYGIHYAGLESCPATIFDRYGVKYGFCAFSPNAHTVSLLQTEHAAHIIRLLKKQCDIVIVSFHGGAEGAAYEHVPHKMESYSGSKRGDVDLFAHKAIDAGADIVLGNGPHVSRALEDYKGRLIAYSLGNFCTYKSVSVAGVCGMAPLLKVKLTRKGEFVGGSIIAFRQTHETGLTRDTLNRVVKRIRMLTQKDFPMSGLEITGNGSIFPRVRD